MNKNSPYYLFDPTSPGSIKRKLAKGDYVSAKELAKVLELHPDCASDLVIVAHNIRLLQGSVEKPKGRPEQTIGRKARICVAGMLAREQMAEWLAGLGDDCPRKGRGEKSLSEAAYEKFAGPLGMSGPALANAVSSLKRSPLFAD